MTDETTLAMHAAQATSALYEERCKRLRKRVDIQHRRIGAALARVDLAAHTGDLDLSAADEIRMALLADD